MPCLQEFTNEYSLGFIIFSIYLSLFSSPLFSLGASQGDQKIGEKIRPNFEKSGQNRHQTKKIKISTSRLNLKVQNMYNKPLLNS
jgi:hypothetical protein